MPLNQKRWQAEICRLCRSRARSTDPVLRRRRVCAQCAASPVPQQADNLREWVKHVTAGITYEGKEA